MNCQSSYLDSRRRRTSEFGFTLTCRESAPRTATKHPSEMKTTSTLPHWPSTGAQNADRFRNYPCRHKGAGYRPHPRFLTSTSWAFRSFCASTATGALAGLSRITDDQYLESFRRAGAETLQERRPWDTTHMCLSVPSIDQTVPSLKPLKFRSSDEGPGRDGNCRLGSWTRTGIALSLWRWPRTECRRRRLPASGGTDHAQDQLSDGDRFWPGRAERPPCSHG